MKKLWTFLKENPIMMFFTVGAMVCLLLALPLLAF